MSGAKGSAYGTPASDTSFRRSYDLDEYAAKAKARESSEREEAKARYEAKLAGKKYHRPATGAETHTAARRGVLDLAAQVGKTQLVRAGAGQGKRGRGAGTYCEACDLTFKDNVQWIEHCNSMQHLRAVGETGEVRKAGAAEVRARVDAVWARVEAARRDDAAATTLRERLEVRREEEDREREARRARRHRDLARRRAGREDAAKLKVEYGEDVRVEGEHDEDDMLAAMGITGFGTSKKKP
ncbi:hypothetical protein F4780DRAFT_782539 [Xylariomycetidae sp. FL0641]|nr:hypothetical protein F4780DRAFT_782539 [Xylariomycetidae sp. FL0641]